MKNIITILAILIIPILCYTILSKGSDNSAVAQDSTKPSLVIFTSTMCMDCQKMKAVIKDVEPMYTGKINFININALDKKRNVQSQIKKYKVVLVPTLVFVDENGNETNKIEGFISKEELMKEIEVAINE